MGIERKADRFLVDTGMISLEIPSGESLPARELLRELYIEDQLLAKAVYPVFCLAHRLEEQGVFKEQILVKESKEPRGDSFGRNGRSGGCQAVFCFWGNHVIGERAKKPFVIRLYLGHGSRELRFVHTFLFDGIENRDFLKGMGIRTVMPMNGKLYNRPRLLPEIFKSQMEGKNIVCEEDSEVEQAAKALSIWQHYTTCQDSAYHFAIKKKTGKEYCSPVCRQEKRSSGFMAVSDERGAIVSDFRYSSYAIKRCL